MLKGVLFVFVLYGTAFFGTIFVMGPTLVLLWLQPRWFRWISDRLVVIWLSLPPVGIQSSYCKHIRGYKNFCCHTIFVYRV